MICKLLGAAGVCFASLGPAMAYPGNEMALVEDGPHRHFAAWEQASGCALKDVSRGASDDCLPQECEAV